MTESQSFHDLVAPEVDAVNGCLNSLFANETAQHQSIQRLLSSARYSLLSDGKRFRPALTLLAAKAAGGNTDQALPFAAAVEMIHTYSLIHDDLPCMDDDSERRGQPTNHVVYGEPMALLAGDGLLTEAFHLLGSTYQDRAEVGLELVRLLGEAAGLHGMVGGQAVDIEVLSGQSVSADDLKIIHDKKTGALIRVAIEGGAVAAHSKHREAFRTFGEKLGLAFQVADDILDYNPENPERSGFPFVLGIDETKKSLEKLTQQALDLLSPFGATAEPLRAVTRFNQERAV